MKKHSVLELPVPEVGVGTAQARSVLEEVVRQGAIQLLQQAIESEVAEYLERYGQERDENSRQRVVRNGYLPQREILSGIGPLPVRQPRVRHRDGHSKFSSAILPPYLRRLPSVEALIPALYLKGVSSGEMQEALEAILGPQAKGLSATNVVRLKATWEQEYESWRKRDLSRKHYVYWWADGIHFNVRLEDERSCILVLMGTLEDGRKELIAITDGYRESKLSWQELLQECKKRGLERAPQLAVGDGGLGFWSALAEEYGSVPAQRCWVHKTANVLDKLPKGVQRHAKSRLHEIYLAPTKAAALVAYEEFLRLYEAKYARACECLRKDQEVLFTFYDFPAQHWVHIRSTNPIESAFATVRHRTRQTKGCGSRTATLAMVFKLALAAQKKWRRLNAPAILGKVVGGVKFVDGEETQEQLAA